MEKVVIGNAELLTGDCISVLKTLPNKSVQCCVTSPPYYGLRRYLFDKAVVLRTDISDIERDYVLEELRKYEIKVRC